MLRLTAAAEDLARLYPWLDSVAAEQAVPDSMLHGMHVALEEAVANVVMHGFAPHQVADIVVHLRRDGGDAVLVVEDTGRPFDPSAAASREPPARLQDAEPGGLGLTLIRHYCTALRYERHGLRNRLTMRFSAPGPPAAAG